MDAGLKILHREVFAAGTVIFTEGSEGSRAYVIETGRVAIWREVDGKRRTLGVVAEGSIFGEMALIDNQPRMASASALTDTTCVVIGEDVFKNKLEAADPFLVGLLRIFMRNIRSLTDKTSGQ
jgi:CRP-like cAMP-binding protein